jgi:hypothetical protein
MGEVGNAGYWGGGGIMTPPRIDANERGGIEMNLITSAIWKRSRAKFGNVRTKD